MNVPRSDLGAVDGDPNRRRTRVLLMSILFSVAAFYAWYCAPFGDGAVGVAVVALFAVAAAVCSAMSVRVAVSSQRRHDARRPVTLLMGDVAI